MVHPRTTQQGAGNIESTAALIADNCSNTKVILPKQALSQVKFLAMYMCDLHNI